MPDIFASADPASILRSHALHQAIRLDYLGGQNPVYIGWALPGSPTSMPRWRVCRLTYDGNGNPTQVDWANGDITYVNAWDNRTILTYS